MLRGRKNRERASGRLATCDVEESFLFSGWQARLAFTAGRKHGFRSPQNRPASVTPGDDSSFYDH
jgi:hypothetical protein